MEITFRLESFEGPLDLLLHLIRQNKVSIYDIPISQILVQYMKILEQAHTMDMDSAGDFIAMAAQLVYIKSRMLLPSCQDEEEDPRTQLVERLIEYQRIKEVIPYFREKTDEGQDIFVREPERIGEIDSVRYSQMPEDLVKAVRRMLHKAQRRLPPPASAFRGIVGQDPVSVSEKIAMIRKRFQFEKRLRLSCLFENAQSRSDLVATFLAVLELSKSPRVRIAGEGETTELLLSETVREDI